MFTHPSFIKGISMLILIGGALFAFYYFLVGDQLPAPFSFILSFVAAMFMHLVISLFRKAYAKWQDLQLMKRAQTGLQPGNLIDRAKIAVFGRILPKNQQPLQAPITHMPCVMYSYGIYQWVYRGSGDNRRRTKQYDYSGHYLTRSYIDTLSGPISLLAMPALEGFPSNSYSPKSETQTLYQNMQTYLDQTTFTSIGPIEFGNLTKGFQLVKDIILDDDGYIRQDNDVRTGHSFSLHDRELDEQYVPVGEDVCLIGTWSQSKQGIVADFQVAPVTLIAGSPQESISRVRKSIFKNLFGGFAVFIAINLIVGIFWFILNVGDQYSTVTNTISLNGIETPIRPSTSTPTPIPIPTISYQIYTHPENLYVYQYSSNWQLKENTSSVWNSLTQIEEPGTSSTLDFNQSPSTFIHFSYEIDGGTCASQELFRSQDQLIPIPINISGIEAQAMEYTNDSQYSRNIYIPYQDRCYIIYTQDTTKNPHQTEINQTISSFQILN